jgi:hypothetical protein
MSAHKTRAGNLAVDNAPEHTHSKIALRRWVMEQLSPAHVLDVFAGIDGEMHTAVWKSAASYVGIDERWRSDDDRQRLVGDSYKILRSIDLERFNLFDIDCYGMPWEAMLIIAARRQWKPGERGAVVCTDSALRARFGFASHAQVAATGLPDRRLGKPDPHRQRAMNDLAIARWSRSSNVRIDQMRRIDGKKTGAAMQYFAFVFHTASANDRDR